MDFDVEWLRGRCILSMYSVLIINISRESKYSVCRIFMQSIELAYKSLFIEKYYSLLLKCGCLSSTYCQCSAKSLVAQLALLGVSNWNFLSSNPPSSKFQIIGKKLFFKVLSSLSSYWCLHFIKSRFIARSFKLFW